MLDKVFFKLINFNLINIYAANVRKFGYNALGLHWSSKSSQYDRFHFVYFLMKKYATKSSQIADIGCGFGDFFDFLINENNVYAYKGYDINPKMIDYCKKKFSPDLFVISDEPVDECDFTIISGTYNYAVYNDIDLWERYIIYNLKKCFIKSSGGVIFNLQKSSRSKIINNIYYAGNDSMTSNLKKNFDKVHSYKDPKTPNDVYFVILRG